MPVWGEKLFDISIDPKEEHNIVRQKTDITENLRKRLASWISKRKRVVIKPKSIKPGLFTNLSVVG
jgi:hypothetical protein